MKVAVVGSRTITVADLAPYLPPETEEIVSGGAKGIDNCAREYALANRIKLTEFLPEYEKYGRGATIVRNKKIVEYADVVVVIWDGKSKGTKSVLNFCDKLRKPVYIHIM